MERLSLAKAVSDRASKQRLQALDGQLKKLKGEQADLTKQWRGEKDDMERLQSVKEEIDRVNLEIQGAERDYDLNRAAELKYGTLMDLQKQLKGAEVALEKQVGTVCSFQFGLHTKMTCPRWAVYAHLCFGLRKHMTCSSVGCTKSASW